MTAPFPGKRYKVIYADPPWSYRSSKPSKSGKGSGHRGAAMNHYEVMDDEAIRSLPVSGIAEGDALLFLWATWPKLPEAWQIMACWGFEYVTAAFVWVKTNADGSPYCGLGRWTRSGSEPVLLGRRAAPAGRGKGPARADLGVRQVVEAPVGRHSGKPAEVRRRIVALCGDVPRIELFAREAAPGWDAWGDEVRRGLLT